jgi:hypothetical protein
LIGVNEDPGASGFFVMARWRCPTICDGHGIWGEVVLEVSVSNLSHSCRRQAQYLAAVLFLLLVPGTAHAQLDPSILNTLKWDELQWFQDSVNPGSWYAVVSGDPLRPGPYVIVNKVLKGNFNRPHFHPYQRQIYVVSGTWWVGSGLVVSPSIAVSRPQGSYVSNAANEVHWDGARDEDVVLLIAGQGPAIDNFAR